MKKLWVGIVVPWLSSIRCASDCVGSAEFFPCPLTCLVEQRECDRIARAGLRSRHCGEYQCALLKAWRRVHAMLEA